MENYSNKVIKTHSDVLFGTVETHNCDPLMDCPECHGTGVCQECNGNGEVRCDDCNGSGKCSDCHGNGKWRCDECRGTGLCSTCHGSGDVTCSSCHGRGRVEHRDFNTGKTSVVECKKCGGTGKTPCPDCRSGLQTAAKVADVLTFGSGRSYGHGSGKCSNCGGTGYIVCDTCKGSGECQTCDGTGRLTCDHCHGSGECPNCDHGKVTCTRCDGSGFYQTFFRQNTTLYAKGWKWSGSTDYHDIVGLASGNQLYNGAVKTWSNARDVSFDKVDDINKACGQLMGAYQGLYSEFLDEYAKQTDLSKPYDANDKPFAKTLNAQRIPVTKIKYTINDQDYELMVVGNNHIVSAKAVPTVVKGFELTKWQKIRLAMTESTRLKSYARLAAYIFQCDGKSQEESVLLEAMIKARKLTPQKEAKFRAELATLNAQMPYKKLRRKIRPLFLSKKTITFAWECMAIDKVVTPQEEELFANIVAEYKLTESDVERYKGMAQRFARLKPDQIAKEYADLAEEMAPLRKKIWKIIIGIIAILALTTLIVVATVTSKGNVKEDDMFLEEDSLEMYDEDDEDDLDIDEDDYTTYESTDTKDEVDDNSFPTEEEIMEAEANIDELPDEFE